jgi:hypothetical protein
VYFDRQKDLAQRAALAGERAELERAEANQLPSQQQRPTRPAIIPHEENR